MTEIKTPLTDSPSPRKSLVISMFNNISGKYDFLNHFLSLGIDKSWRRKAILMLKTI
jgi:demethylmenaquinone methyltransferase / 2-methoxy-6-polyprenyl-1,4-benzoquinol methylase